MSTITDYRTCVENTSAATIKCVESNINTKTTLWFLPKRFQPWKDCEAVRAEVFEPCTKIMDELYKSK